MSIAQVSEAFSDPLELLGAALHAGLGGTLIEVEAQSLSPSLQTRRGAFVTLLKGGSLRGSMGTFWPIHRHAGREVVWSGLQAALNDVRFPPLAASELDEIEGVVDLIDDPKPISIDDVDKVAAVLVEISGVQAVILPAMPRMKLGDISVLGGPGFTSFSSLAGIFTEISASSGQSSLVKRIIEVIGGGKKHSLWGARCERFYGPLRRRQPGDLNGI
ncbi:MAG: hypothetical protein C4319_00180 [Acidimicrobiia bacterium]